MNDDDIKLGSKGVTSPDDVHGFYATAPGRNFLRTLYPRYILRVGFGDTKLASNIADETAINQDKENELTEQALKRWVKKQQKELWVRDGRKTLRVDESARE